MTKASCVTRWNEYQQKKTDIEVAKLYPEGIQFRKFMAFFSRVLNCAWQGAIIVLAVTLSSTTASSSTRSPITDNPTLRNGKTVQLTLPLAQHLPTPRRFDLAQDDVTANETRTQRILFKRGAVSTVVESTIGRGSRTIYLLRARGGQIMTLSLTSLDQNAVFDVQAPDGQYLKQEATSYRGELPLTGDYSVIVSGIRGNAEYTLDVTIR
ncbi:hypothetical protein [Allocoleopsis sp.]|uniref:hypothetical protein n=1 Tax=Allocoleopsis sp. TaxID=3088169 RepID=UPI002FD69101